MSCSIWQHVLLALEHIPSVFVGTMNDAETWWFGTVASLMYKAIQNNPNKVEPYQLPITVGNEGLFRDPLLKMVVAVTGGVAAPNVTIQFVEITSDCHWSIMVPQLMGNCGWTF